MSRTFAYSRVSTREQTAENQIQAIRSRGYDVADRHHFSETISGSVIAKDRPVFQQMLNKLDEGDTLVVLKIDRLGRDNIDVQQTITSLLDMGVRVVSLDLPTNDLGSAEGKMMLQMFSAFAEFERSRLIERTQEGLSRAKAKGTRLGRTPGSKYTEKVQKCKAANLSQSETAETLGIAIRTVKRNWNIEG